MAYFQSYTGTYGSPDRIKRLISEALSVSGIAGLCIGTRPDCISAGLMRWLGALDVPVFMEFGAESSHDSTLRLINRGHSWRATAEALELAHSAGLQAGLHLIMGLPGESTGDMLLTVERAVDAGADSLKLHQLQVVRDTPLAEMYAANPAGLRLFSPAEYAALCAQIVSIVPRTVCIERFVGQTPPEMLVAPRWNIKNYQFTDLLLNLLKNRNHG